MKIRIYVARVQEAIGYGHFGIAITPDAALEIAQKVGHLNKAQMKKCRIDMRRLPEGITDIDVDEMGSINWQGGAEGAKAESIALVDGHWKV